MQQERFLVGAVQRVDPLLVLAGAERRDHDRLRFTAGEQRRAVRTRQHADFGDDRTHGHEIAAVDALRSVEDVPANDLAFEFLEHACDLRHRAFRIVDAVRKEMRHRLLLDGGDGVLTFGLARDRIGGAQILFHDAEHFLLDRGDVRRIELARLLGGFFRQIDDRLDHRLEMPVAEHHGTEHDVFGELLGFQLHHQHGVLRAGDDEVELALGHLVDGRVENVFAVGEADAGAADRAHEGRTGERERGGSGDHRDDVGIIFLVVRERGDDHLRVAAPAVGEERTDRAVDQARGERVLFGRSAFALEEAAGDAARGVVFFLVVDRERQEVDAGLRCFCRDDGRDHGGFAVGGDNGAIGLARDFSGLEGELAPAPIEFNSADIKHVFRLSWFRTKV